MEERDEDMLAVISARIGGIEDLPPRIEADADAIAADPALKPLADAQAAHLRARLAAVANLQEALAHLAMSDFRGVAALEVCGSPTLQRWEVIEPWCLIRPARRGPWLYNPTATPGAVNGEALDPARVIITEARAIDLPCMFLLCAKYHSTSGWDAFLDVFGNPSLFLELPPQTTPQMAQEYDAIVRQIIGEGRGTIPSGSKFQTVETGQNSADSFAARAEWCKKAIITLALGGTLTMMSESGTGTLAGSAHSDSLSRLITATARRISRAVDTQWAAPILRTAFPGKPILAHFTLRAEEERDTAAAAQLLATLAGAGYTVTEAQAEELLGFPVTYHAPAAPQPFTNTDPEPPTDPTDPAPLTNTTDPTPAPAEADAPLTEAELTALRSLTSAPLSPASLTPALSSALTSALTNRTNPQQDEEGQGDEGQGEDDPTDPDDDPDPEDPDPEDPNPTDPEDTPARDGTPDPTPDTPTTDPAPPEEAPPTQATEDPEEEDVENGLNRGQRRDRRGRFTGKNHKGTTRVSKGKRKRNVPAIAPENASDQKKVSALDHAFKKTEKGGKVRGAIHLDGKPLDVEAGHPARFGVTHAKRHFRPGDTSAKETVRTIVYGKRKKDTSPEKERPESDKKKLSKKEKRRLRKLMKRKAEKFNTIRKGTQFTGLNEAGRIRIITSHTK
ncbi:MAG: DUF935 family protein [Akkermansia sp.]|nr:DUF935 family protein [Akkermansia sp.]